MAKAGKGNQDIVEQLRQSTIGKVKVACSDIDGVLRGKYIHRDKFFSAVESGSATSSPPTGSPTLRARARC